MQDICTIEEVVDAVGGRSAAAELAGLTSPNAVSNWKARGRIPAELFFLFARKLRTVGKRPDPALFGFASVEAAE